MKLAFRTDKKILFQIFPERNRAAIFALGPKAFRAHAPLFRRRRFVNSFFFSFEPGHEISLGFRAFSSLYHAARECLSCTGVSLLSSRSQGPQAPLASDARFSPCKSRVHAPDDLSMHPQFSPDRAFCS